MKGLMLLLFIMAFATSAIGRYSVTKEVGQHSTTYIAALETVYLNPNLEDGKNKYELSIVLNKDTDVVKGCYYMLQCRYTTSGAYLIQECAPSAISFLGPDESDKGIIYALTEKDAGINRPGLRSRVFTYELTAELVNHLRTNSLGYIIFWDKRTHHSKECTPIRT